MTATDSNNPFAPFPGPFPHFQVPNGPPDFGNYAPAIVDTVNGVVWEAKRIAPWFTSTQPSPVLAIENGSLTAQSTSQPPATPAGAKHSGNVQPSNVCQLCKLDPKKNRNARSVGLFDTPNGRMKHARTHVRTLNCPPQEAYNRCFIPEPTPEKPGPTGGPAISASDNFIPPTPVRKAKPLTESTTKDQAGRLILGSVLKGPGSTPSDTQLYHDVMVKLSDKIAFENKKGAGPVECGQCSKTFSNKDNGIRNLGTLDDHVLSHMTANLYSCPLCGEEINILSSHIQESHPETRNLADLEESKELVPGVLSRAWENLRACFPLLADSVLPSSAKLPPKPTMPPPELIPQPTPGRKNRTSFTSDLPGDTSFKTYSTPANPVKRSRKSSPHFPPPQTVAKKDDVREEPEDRHVPSPVKVHSAMPVLTPLNISPNDGSAKSNQQKRKDQETEKQNLDVSLGSGNGNRKRGSSGVRKMDSSLVEAHSESQSLNDSLDQSSSSWKKMRTSSDDSILSPSGETVEIVDGKVQYSEWVKFFDASHQVGHLILGKLKDGESDIACQTCLELFNVQRDSLPRDVMTHVFKHARDSNPGQNFYRCEECGHESGNGILMRTHLKSHGITNNKPPVAPEHRMKVFKELKASFPDFFVFPDLEMEEMEEPESEPAEEDSPQDGQVIEEEDEENEKGDSAIDQTIEEEEFQQELEAFKENESAMMDVLEEEEGLKTEKDLNEEGNTDNPAGTTEKVNETHNHTLNVISKHLLSASGLEEEMNEEEEQGPTDDHASKDSMDAVLQEYDAILGESDEQSGVGNPMAQLEERLTQTVSGGIIAKKLGCSHSGCTKSLKGSQITVEKVEKHILEHMGGAKPFTCAECNKEFPTRKATESHLIKSHKEMSYQAKENVDLTRQKKLDQFLRVFDMCYP